jgi:hypothetical protein
MVRNYGIHRRDAEDAEICRDLRKEFFYSLRSPRLCGKIFDNASLNTGGLKMAKNVLRLKDKGYGSDHLLKSQKDYTCQWCEKSIRKGELYARHSPNKFKDPFQPVCRACAWWLK